MQVQLNEAELEVAVTLYLSSQGMNLKNKELSFSFEGECSMDIEATTDEAPKPKQTRKKAAPKKQEPVKAPEVTPEPVKEEEPTVAIEEVVEALEEQVQKPEVLDPEDLFPAPKVTEAKPSNENSIFA